MVFSEEKCGECNKFNSRDHRWAHVLSRWAVFTRGHLTLRTRLTGTLHTLCTPGQHDIQLPPHTHTHSCRKSRSPARLTNYRRWWSIEGPHATLQTTHIEQPGQVSWGNDTGAPLWWPFIFVMTHSQATDTIVNTQTACITCSVAHLPSINLSLFTTALGLIKVIFSTNASHQRLFVFTVLLSWLFI